MSKQFKCDTCKDDPRGVLGLNSYSACPECNILPMTGAEKDRATYDLVRVLEAPFVRSNPDMEEKRSKL